MEYTGATFVLLLLSLIFSVLALLRNVGFNVLKKFGKENVKYLNHIVTMHGRVGILSAIFFIVHLILASNVTSLAIIVLALMLLSAVFAITVKKGRKYLITHKIVAFLSLIALIVYFFI